MQKRELKVRKRAKLTGFGRFFGLFGLFDNPMAGAGLGMKARRPTGAFSRRFGIRSQWCQIEQKGESITLNLPGGQRSRRGRCGWTLPRRTAVRYFVTNEQKLGIGKSTEPDPTLVMSKSGGTAGSQSQMLFHEAKHMLNGKTPEIDVANISQWRGPGTGPKEKEWPLEARRAIRFEKFNPQDKAGQEGQGAQMQTCPGRKTYLLVSTSRNLAILGCCGWGRAAKQIFPRNKVSDWAVS